MDPEVVRLVRAAQDGDPIAMNDLLDVLVPFVGRLCGPIALDHAEDAAQEALIIVFRRIRSLREPGALFGWVRTIAVREAVRVAQQASARPATEMPDIPDPAPTTLAVELRDVLAQLAPAQRDILVLRDIQGLDEREVSALLGVRPGTVKSRLHRARESFRRRWSA